MIPVTPQPEPADFDVSVRRAGAEWLRRRQLDPTLPLPDGVKLEGYWTRCLPQLRAAYGAICAYVCVHVELVVGNSTVEHFEPKKRRPDLAYEWSNYRYVCGTMNGRKSDYTDVLDPFALRTTPFELNFADFSINVRTDLNSALTALALSTIGRLKLDSAECRQLRANHYDEYLAGDISESKFRRESPFVHAEARRLDLLR